MNTITLILNDKQIAQLKMIFANEMSAKKPAYSLFSIKTENCVITVYESKKAVFQGKDAEIYAASFMKKDIEEQAGSDEVGTGDVFGPVCVCACYINKEIYDQIADLELQDSKKCTDEYILSIGEKLMNIVPHSLLILTNEIYNKVHDHNNLNMIKAKMHNKAYINLGKKVTLPKLKVIDQFTPEKSYYSYISNEPEIERDIYFTTKAEDKYISVACASMIARYAFLKSMESLCAKYDFEFHKGASLMVDDDLKKFIKKHGKENLCHVAKLHFKNIQNL